MTSEFEVPAAGSRAVELDLPGAQTGPSDSASDQGGQRPEAPATRAGRRPRPLTVLSVLALVLFAAL